MAADWVREIRDRCVGNGVPFFFKQWGGVRKGRTGRLLDGRTWDELPRPLLRWHHSKPAGSANTDSVVPAHCVQAGP